MAAKASPNSDEEVTSVIPIAAQQQPDVPPRGTTCYLCTEEAVEYDYMHRPVCGIPTNHD